MYIRATFREPRKLSSVITALIPELKAAVSLSVNIGRPAVLMLHMAVMRESNFLIPRRIKRRVPPTVILE